MGMGAGAGAGDATAAVQPNFLPEGTARILCYTLVHPGWSGFLGALSSVAALFTLVFRRLLHASQLGGLHFVSSLCASCADSLLSVLFLFFSQCTGFVCFSAH